MGDRRFRSAQCAPFARRLAGPSIAAPVSVMIVQTSAKSRLTRPSLIIRSVMQATPEHST